MRDYRVRDLHGLDRWIWVLAQVCGVAAVAIYLTRLGSSPGRSTVLALLVVVVWSVAVAWRPRSSALLGSLALVPALVVGRLWREGTVPRGSFGWFAYAPLSSTVSAVRFARPTDLAVGALAVLLLVVTALGLVAAVRTLRPDRGPVRTLAVVAAVLTVPLWAPPSAHQTPWGVMLRAADVPPRVAVVRTVALALVVVVGIAVVLARGRVPARTAAYAVPAVAMTWVVWHTHSDVYYLIDSAQAAPGPLDTLAFVVPQVTAIVLVAVLWVLSVVGLRELVTRYRPPEAVLTP